MSLIYYLPGRGNRLQGEGIGALVQRLGGQVRGRELQGDFTRLAFAEQLAVIQGDLLDEFWSPQALLIGHSYGAYLLLHGLAELPACPGRVLLFSPVLGVGMNRERMFASWPPRAKRLLTLAETQSFPVPRGGLQIYSGAADDGCDPDLARRFVAALPGAALQLVPDAGHHLDESLLVAVLSRAITTP